MEFWALVLFHTVTLDVPKDLRAAVDKYLAQQVGGPEAGE